MGYPSCLNDVYARYGRGGRAKTAAHAKAALAVSSLFGDRGSQKKPGGYGAGPAGRANPAAAHIRPEFAEYSNPLLDFFRGIFSGSGGTRSPDLGYNLNGTDGVRRYADSLRRGTGTGDMLQRLPYYFGERGSEPSDPYRRLPYYFGERGSEPSDPYRRLSNYSGPGLRNATNKPSWLLGGGGTGAQGAEPTWSAQQAQDYMYSIAPDLAAPAGRRNRGATSSPALQEHALVRSAYGDDFYQRWRENRNAFHQRLSKSMSDRMSDPQWRREQSKWLLA